MKREWLTLKGILTYAYKWSSMGPAEVFSATKVLKSTMLVLSTVTMQRL